jgi:hypothetical protein
MTQDAQDFLKLLSEAPDGQLDKQVTDMLKQLIGKPKEEVKVGVMKAIDYCVRYGLSSGFALQSLHMFHEMHLDGSHADFTDENCPWRKE